MPPTETFIPMKGIWGQLVRQEPFGYQNWLILHGNLHKSPTVIFWKMKGGGHDVKHEALSYWYKSIGQEMLQNAPIEML